VDCSGLQAVGSITDADWLSESLFTSKISNRHITLYYACILSEEISCIASYCNYFCVQLLNSGNIESSLLWCSIRFVSIKDVANSCVICNLVTFL